MARTNAGDYAGANADLTRALQSLPDQMLGYYYRGMARAGLGDQAGVVEDFTRVLQMEPDYAPAWYSRAVALAQQGDTAGAVADLEQAASLYARQGDATSAQRIRELITSLQG